MGSVKFAELPHILFDIYAEGLNDKEILSKYGIGKTTLWRYKKTLGLSTDRLDPYVSQCDLIA
ncbi:MAG: hypothetical protein J6Z43_08050 [Clostridiales bacterium]|nr:hypothetical protein [Clostridiales bacterium]